MSFDELMDVACESVALPNMARLLLPNTLSGETKKVVMKLRPEEDGRIFKVAIDQIDSSSVESVDVMVRKALNN